MTALIFLIFVAIPSSIYHFYLGEMALGFISLILSPIIFWIVVYIIKAVGCWFYNLIAKRMGGVEFNLVDLEHVTVREDVGVQNKPISDVKDQL